MAQTHLPPQWRERLLEVVNGKVTAENLRLLDAWQKAEGGTAQWNPLNTTYYLAGATLYNDTKVRNYRYPIEGVCATALTLCGRDAGTLRYGGILGDLQSGSKTALGIVSNRGDEFKRWGTNPYLISLLLTEGGTP